MARAELISETSYAYLGTLSRLDRNGDGVLSRSERAADDKPGILSKFSQDETSDTGRGNRLSSSVLDYMLQNQASEGTMPVEVDQLYASTYGQYT